MRKIVLLALGVVVIASVASAQGLIGLYSDADTYGDCNLIDATLGLCSVYLVQHYQTGISSSMRVEDNTGLTSTGVTVHTALSIGDVFTGIDFSYGACLGPTVLLATLNYFCQGVTAPCSGMRVRPHPETGVITLVDCTPTARTPAAGILMVNGDDVCPCSGAVPGVDASSWGRIKALYDED